MRTLRLGACAGVLFVAACVNGLDSPPALQYATFFLNVSGSGPSLTLTPNGQVFSSSGVDLPLSTAALDTCVLAVFGTNSPAALQNISGGDSIGITVGSVTRYMKPTTSGGQTNFALSSPETMSIAPGGQYTITLPGATNGFPAATVTSNTPAPIVVNTPALQTDNSFNLTWTPAGDDSSRVTIALEYAVSPSTTLNQQIFCQFKDDGSGTVRADLSTAYRASSLHRVEASRWRTALRAVNGNNARLFVYSSYNITPFTP